MYSLLNINWNPNPELFNLDAKAAEDRNKGGAEMACHPHHDRCQHNGQHGAFHYDDGVFICHVFALNENEVLSFCDI